MTSVLLILPMNFHILLVLNSLGPSLSVIKSQEYADIQLETRKTTRWSIYMENSRLRDKNFQDRYSHNSFLDGSSKIIDKPDPRQTVNFTAIVNATSNPNITIVVFNAAYTKIPSPTQPSTLQNNLGKTYASQSEAECKKYCDDIINFKPRTSDPAGKANISLTKSRTERTNSHLTVRRLVVGGKRAAPHEYPHVVALGRRNKGNAFVLLCGGTLISPKWILTAAHCTHGISGGVTIARLGIKRLSANDGWTIAINRTVRHPSYKPPAMYTDIALLELVESVALGITIKPACLHQQYDNVPITAWVCGWGATEFGGNESDTLQKARLDIVDNVQCALKHNRSIAVPDGVVPSMICAGTPRNQWHRDTCHGDSGGPLFVDDPAQTCGQRIIGITSFGAGCAFADSPGVYTRVSHYLDWLESIVWPNNG